MASSQLDYISLDRISLSLGGVVLYRNISIQIGDGEFFCILGPSGCGKSTTLRVISGLQPIDSGTVTIAGQPARDRWRDIAFVFQSPRLLPWRTARENVALGLEMRFPGMTKAEELKRADQMLDTVGLFADREKYPRMLSGGERQRVAIARAWAVEPTIILMDEPFSALDPHTRQRMREELIGLWSGTGKTVVFVTHDVDEALLLADRIILLSAKPTRVLDTMVVEDARPRVIDGDAGMTERHRHLIELFPFVDETPTMQTEESRNALAET